MQIFWDKNFWTTKIGMTPNIWLAKLKSSISWKLEVVGRKGRNFVITTRVIVLWVSRHFAVSSSLVSSRRLVSSSRLVSSNNSHSWWPHNGRLHERFRAWVRSRSPAKKQKQKPKKKQHNSCDLFFCIKKWCEMAFPWPLCTALEYLSGWTSRAPSSEPTLRVSEILYFVEVPY